MSWWNSIPGLSKLGLTSSPGHAHSAPVEISPATRDATLREIGVYELLARTIVDGLMSGKHRSSHRGGCSDFAEYRPYSQGDSIRLIDWRVAARRDRHYIKLYDDETNLRCWMVLDDSASMAFGQSTLTKAQYARLLLACLGRLMLRQRDSVGLLSDGGGQPMRLMPSPHASHFKALCQVIEATRPAGNTPLPELLIQLPHLMKRRGMVLVFSDCFSDLDSLAHALRILRVRGHDVIVFQILAPEEIRFDFRKSAMFEDLEKGVEGLRIDPGRIRRRYLERFGTHQQQLQEMVTNCGGELVQCSTEVNVAILLKKFLASRAARNTFGSAAASTGGNR